MKLSIITINYNNLEGLTRTMESVKCQTFDDYEWIVIDGGSTDGSRELILANQQLFSFWCSEEDKGIYDAINKGIAQAHGQYISCLNSGDEYFSDDTLQKVFAVPPSSDIVYGDWYKVYPDKRVLCSMPYPLDFSILYFHNICHQAMFIHTSALQEKGFDLSYSTVADYARWMEMLFAGATFQKVDIIVCNYDMTGISSQDKAGWEECQRIRREIVPEWLRPTMQRLSLYETSRDHLCLLLIQKRGGLLRFITHNLLKLIGFLFFNINKDMVNFHRIPGRCPENPQ